MYLRSLNIFHFPFSVRMSNVSERIAVTYTKKNRIRAGKAELSWKGWNLSRLDLSICGLVWWWFHRKPKPKIKFDHYTIHFQGRRGITSVMFFISLKPSRLHIAVSFIYLIPNGQHQSLQLQKLTFKKAITVIIN